MIHLSLLLLLVTVLKQLSDKLLEYGVFAQGIAFPTVQKGKARVRTIVTSEHTKELLDEALHAFEKAGKELGIIS